MTHQIVSQKLCLLIFAVLMVLTASNVGVAYVDLGQLNVIIALSIAVCQALLVILYFMHVRYSSQLTKLVVVAGFCWLVLLIGLTLSDFLTRDWLPLPEGW